MTAVLDKELTPAPVLVIITLLITPTAFSITMIYGAKGREQKLHRKGLQCFLRSAGARGHSVFRTKPVLETSEINGTLWAPNIFPLDFFFFLKTFILQKGLQKWKCLWKKCFSLFKHYCGKTKNKKSSVKVFKSSLFMSKKDILAICWWTPSFIQVSSWGWLMLFGLTVSPKLPGWETF